MFPLFIPERSDINSNWLETRFSSDSPVSTNIVPTRAAPVVRKEFPEMWMFDELKTVGY